MSSGWTNQKSSCGSPTDCWADPDLLSAWLLSPVSRQEEPNSCSCRQPLKPSSSENDDDETHHQFEQTVNIQLLLF